MSVPKTVAQFRNLGRGMKWVRLASNLTIIAIPTSYCNITAEAQVKFKSDCKLPTLQCQSINSIIGLSFRCDLYVS